MKNIICSTEKDTQNLAVKLANSLKGGEIIALQGDLGAGKTTFTQYLAESLKIKQAITSPTFVLMKVYKVGSKKSKVDQLVHVDCYRLDDAQELFYLGLEEYLNKKDTVVIIEWADKIKKYLHKFKKTNWLKIKVRDKEREFIFS